MENKREKNKVKRGLWKPEEDLILKNYVETHGEGNWAAVSEKSGLMRGGKSCRLRWKNYLRPNIKRGCMSQEEEDLIIRMHKLIGNRWSLIAGRLPGRTDNEVKNYWNTHLNKKLSRLGKRKTIEDNPPEDTGSNKKLRRFSDSQPVCRAAEEKRNIDEQEKENRTRINETNWTEDKYEMVLPVDADDNNATFVFDDEPFITYLDSFVLFEAFEFASEGMHSITCMDPPPPERCT